MTERITQRLTDRPAEGNAAPHAAGDAGAVPAPNPFATRFTRPGALPYVFLPSSEVGPQTTAQRQTEAGMQPIVDRLRQHGWRGQIIGPHGSGKSTLLASLVPRLAALRCRPVCFTLRQGQRRLPRRWHRDFPAVADFPGFVVIDGFEQLSRWRRRQVFWMCRWLRSGLLVTGHVPLGLPTVFATDVSSELAQVLVARLASPSCAEVAVDDVKQCFKSRRGNIREMFFDLYDLYESRRS